MGGGDLLMVVRPATASSPSLSFFLRSRSSCLFSLCNGVRMTFWSKETGITTYLELFPTFPRILFLLAFNLLLLLFLLRWSQNHDPLERVGSRHTSSFSSRSLVSFSSFSGSSSFRLLSFCSGVGVTIPSEEVGLHVPRVFPCVPSLLSPSHVQVPFAFVLWPLFLSFRVQPPFVSFPSVIESEICSVGSSGDYTAPRALPPVP